MAQALTGGQKGIVATTIAAALALPMEGLYQQVYYDPPGVLTVCVGHTGPDVVAGKTYSRAECIALLNKDMQKAVKAVDRCVPDAPLHVLAAFGDAAFNVGPDIACDTKGSTAARLLRAGEFDAACNQLPRWDKARIAGVLVPLPGLTKRRGLEQQLCLTGVLPAEFQPKAEDVAALGP